MKKKEVVIIPEINEPVEAETTEIVKTKVNEAREKFLKRHDQVMKRNRIVSLIYFGLTIAFVLAGSFVEALMGVAIGIICAGLVVVWIFTRQQRRQIEIGTQEYLKEYSLYANSYMYGKDDVENLKIEYRKGVDLELIKKIDIADEEYIVNSRDTVSGKMYGNDFLAVDVSLKKGNPKKVSEQKALFVGKVFALNYKFVNEGRTLLYLKGCGDAAPTKLQDVNEVNVPSLKKEWKVYTSHKAHEKIFNASLIKVLNKLECNDTLNDIVISIEDGVVLVAYSYSDEAMVIPMRKTYEPSYLDIKKDNYKLFKAINRALIENDNFTK